MTWKQEWTCSLKRSNFTFSLTKEVERERVLMPKEVPGRQKHKQIRSRLPVLLLNAPHVSIYVKKNVLLKIQVAATHLSYVQPNVYISPSAGWTTGVEDHGVAGGVGIRGACSLTGSIWSSGGRGRRQPKWTAESLLETGHLILPWKRSQDRDFY